MSGKRSYSGRQSRHNALRLLTRTAKPIATFSSLSRVTTRTACSMRSLDMADGSRAVRRVVARELSRVPKRCRASSSDDGA
jgi:hypothetical protein